MSGGLDMRIGDALQTGLRGGVLVLVLWLQACAGGANFAPVIEQSGAPSRKLQTHVVSSGETLHAIAWRYGMDYRQLARANNIAPPYTIRPGQQLSLAVSAAAPAQAGTAVANAPRRGAAGTPAAAPPASAGTSARSAPAPSTTPPPTASPGASPGRWHWPASGRVTRAFNAQSATNRGIDIQGELGQPVFAANDGTVVYAGSGLVGYGNLLIVKHAGQYLSAYGHNSRLLVREGQSVKAGQRIAEIGDSGTDSVKLHFEIRHNGRAVDPLSLLPRR